MDGNVNKFPRVYILGSTLIALLGITVVLLPTDPLIAARIASLRHPGDGIVHEKFHPDSAAVMDVPLGTALPENGAGKIIRSRQQHSSCGFLVVGLGNCASCIRFDFAEWQKQAAALHVPLIGFSGATQQQISEYRHDAKITAPIYFDEQNALGKTINSYWNGRVYYYDSNWRLAWRMEGFGNPHNLDQLPELKNLIGRGNDSKK